MMPRSHKKRKPRKRHYVHGVIMTGSPEQPGITRIRSAFNRLEKRGQVERVGVLRTGKPGRPSVLWATPEWRRIHEGHDLCEACVKCRDCGQTHDPECALVRGGTA